MRIGSIISYDAGPARETISHQMSVFSYVSPNRASAAQRHRRDRCLARGRVLMTTMMCQSNAVARRLDGLSHARDFMGELLHGTLWDHEGCPEVKGSRGNMAAEEER
jgi:hypothetical protein